MENIVEKISSCHNIYLKCCDLKKEMINLILNNKKYLNRIYFNQNGYTYGIRHIKGRRMYLNVVGYCHVEFLKKWDVDIDYFELSALFQIVNLIKSNIEHSELQQIIKKNNL